MWKVVPTEINIAGMQWETETREVVGRVSKLLTRVNTEIVL